VAGIWQASPAQGGHSVVHTADAVTVTILLSSPGTSVDQCYRFTRPVAGDDGQGSATAVPG
jgi:hypothetical protein